MKNVFFVICLFAQVASANSQLRAGAASPETFTATIDNENPMKLSVQKLTSGETQTLKFKNTISDIKKLTISTQDKKNKMIQIEILLVVLTVFDKEQSVQAFIPVKPEAFEIKGKLNPVCALRNEGDFSWDSDSDLEKRVRLVNEKNQEKFQIQIGRYKEGKTQFSWVDCFSF